MITTQERWALTKFLDHAKEGNISKFDMGDAHYCIGGYMLKYLQRKYWFRHWFRLKYFMISSLSYSLDPLFFEKTSPSITVKQVIPVIEHFLQTEIVDWSKMA